MTLGVGKYSWSIRYVAAFVGVRRCCNDPITRYINLEEEVLFALWTFRVSLSINVRGVSHRIVIIQAILLEISYSKVEVNLHLSSVAAAWAT